ncbi:MAG TPA: GNAT family N-acetyltransferase [Solirubrobacteraceae bacterium]|nr:GNAT family N-acetyltransferase [Solirubrobacteraceae bacterium]
MLNTLHVTAPLKADVDAGALTGELDRLYGGLAHRRVVVDDDATGRRLADGLRDRGYACSAELVMALSAPRDRESAGADAGECSSDDLGAVERAFMRAEGRAEDLIDELLAMRGALWAARPGTRWFVARADGRPGASATLYSDGTVAQVEDVGTLPELRGRGLGRAVVCAAVDAAVAAGHELVFLVADADDWPRNLYAKLGFREIGREWACLREAARAA